MAGQQPGLNGWEQSRCDGSSEEVVRPLALPGSLPLGEHELPSVLGEADRSAGKLLEVVWSQLAAVEEGEREPVGENWSVLLHEVQGEGGLAGAQAVEEPDVGVKPDLLGAAVDGAAEQAVEEGQHGVDGVGWRAAWCAA